VKRRALISVSDKNGVAEFALGLTNLGWEILSTGGTARALREAGVHVIDVSDVTQHAEMMDGRVKTLHPAIHAGLLARRERADDMVALAEHGYGPIDLVCVNLYPFGKAAARGAPLGEAMEQVDIGGPSMLRSAAKNHDSVYVVVDPSDYARVLEAVRVFDNTGLRLELARKVFAHTGEYDTAIAGYLARFEEAASDGESPFPQNLSLSLHRVQPLRYGENPDQAAAFYAEARAPDGAIPSMKQLHGKELSFNNLLDIEAAATAVSAWHGEGPACVIIKHTTPCGVARGDTMEHAWESALACDPVSAFGGIVGFNLPVSEAIAAMLAERFLEIVIAPSFEAGALEVLQRKKNLRLITLPMTPAGAGEMDFKRVRGGFLVQARMSMQFDDATWRVVTRRSPTPAEVKDLRFAWQVAASVKSNAIVLAVGEATVGIGAGQMSRVDASRIAVMKANDQKLEIRGASLASDAFFPFRDGIDAAAAEGVAAVIQPGGSVRDEEVIGAADEHGMAMVFTGRRVFRH
jgi:phosphoribosylaminoimidazolecarboxamide formyltransferase / IMP cyclohydrolase